MSKNVLITGSSRGIGEAIALKYAREGCQVVINCRSSEQALASVQKKVEALGARCLAVRADVGNRNDCIRLFQEIEGSFGPLDILINNAGISQIGLLQDMEFEEWDQLIASNLSSVFHCCKLAIPGMVRKQCGKIINISSVWGVCGASCEAAYSASKGGVNALTRALAKELAIQYPGQCRRLRSDRHRHEPLSLSRGTGSASYGNPGRTHGQAGGSGRARIPAYRSSLLSDRTGDPARRGVDLAERLRPAESPPQ